MWFSLPGPIEVSMPPNWKGNMFLSPPHPRPSAPSISFSHPRSPMEADTQPGRGRGLQTSPPRRGRGLLIVSTGRGRGLRPISSPHVGRGLSVPQLGMGRSKISFPSLPQIFSLLWWGQEQEQGPYCRSGQGAVEWRPGVGPIGNPPCPPYTLLRYLTYAQSPQSHFPIPPGTVAWLNPPNNVPRYPSTPIPTSHWQHGWPPPYTLIDLTMGQNHLPESFEYSEGPPH